MPHDAVHFVVERALGLKDAFFGQIARGSELNSVAQPGKDASIRKTCSALQAESLVECFQALLWNGGRVDAAFIDALALTCAVRGVPLPACTSVTRLRAAQTHLIDLNQAWQKLPVGKRLVRTWVETVSRSNLRKN